MKQKPLVFVCQPRHGRQVDAGALSGLLAWPTLGMCNTHWGNPSSGSPISGESSLLPYNFNKLWCEALNVREAGVFRITHFAMLHADIQPMHGWVDVLVSELERHRADVISTVVPLKISTGVTSTGVGDADWPRGRVDPYERARKLTMHECCNLLPPTFNLADVERAGLGVREEGRNVLLLNTGCWVCRFDASWCEQITFREYDAIYRGADGRWHAACRGEDWEASFQFHDLGLKVMATTLCRVEHHGDFGYSNWPAWGTMQTDEDWKAVQAQRSKLLAIEPAQVFEDTGISPVAGNEH